VRQQNHLAVRAAKIGARLVAAGLGRFGFLALVFSEFFVSVRERIPRCEHGVAPRLFLFLAQGAEFVADLADGALDGLHFNEQIADFL